MGKHNSKNKSLMMDAFSVFPIQELPDDLLAEIFIHIPGKDLVQTCSLVCSRWYGVLETQKLWKDKCILDYHFSPEVLATLSMVPDADFKKIYFKNPYTENLLRNSDASEGLTHWVIKSNRGNGFTVESKPLGCFPVTNYTGPDFKGREMGCWATSYGDCYKKQVLNLIELGCSERVLDHLRPNIIISEWYAARFDCGIEYMLHVQLLKDKKDKIPLHEYKFEDVKPAGRDWFNVQYTFSGYKPGVRYIRYFHGGKDTQFWAGHYGVKMTLSTVRLDLKNTAGPEKQAELGLHSQEVGVESHTDKNGI